MRLTLVLITFLGLAGLAQANEIDYFEGSVVYKGDCPSKFAFSYFDGRRVQQPCIEDSPRVTVRAFLFESRNTDCPGEVALVRGRVVEGALQADEIAPVLGCSDFDLQ